MTMKRFALVSKILICLLGAFFILMSFDVFAMEGTIWELLGGFLISISPGLVMIGAVLLFWYKERILAIICFALAVAWTIFIAFEGQFPDMIGGLLIVDIPLVLAGIVLLFSSFEHNKG